VTQSCSANIPAMGTILSVLLTAIGCAGAHILRDESSWLARRFDQWAVLGMCGTVGSYQTRSVEAYVRSRGLYVLLLALCFYAVEIRKWNARLE